ncbi:metal ABC transporter permease [uncultured Tyzzerella sp.]|uniref:metal ABC transporter permease n=1 Tax=uncultured Tyzzerella sp. TaxID=2321398 RepID=UPI002943D7FA|nr:metal ABC transporter permease [uncultured Tyzzerella sp.]
MISLIKEILSYPFMVRALVVGVFIALCASLLGVSMVLKRYSMIGDGLSHVGFGALAISTALKLQPLVISLPIVVIAAFFLLKIKESSKIKGDAAIAIISTGSLAVGILVLSTTVGMNTDVNNYLFGSILGVNENEVALTVILCTIIFILFILLYNRIFAVTFDENFVMSIGNKVEVYNMIIAILTAIIIVLGMRTMGALLMSSLIIFPALTAMRIFKQFKKVVIFSGIISVFCFILGLLISYLYAMPTGASVSVLNIILFIFFYIIE